MSQDFKAPPSYLDETGAGIAPASDFAVIASRTGIGLTRQDADLRYLWSANVPEGWPQPANVGSRDDPASGNPEQARLAALKMAVLETGHAARAEVVVGSGMAARGFDVHLDMADGGILTTIIDRTEERRRERSLRSLLREVSHRSRNLLAIVLSIAVQTGRNSESITVFIERFRGRIQALAVAQELITASDWGTVSLDELARGQVDQMPGLARDALRMTGSEVRLSPNAALHVGLGLHELVSNSIRFGALRSQGGHVDVAVDVQSDGGPPTLRIEWREASTSPSQSEAVRRFGTVALERVVPSSIGGKAEFAQTDGELVYRLTIPAAEFES